MSKIYSWLELFKLIEKDPSKYLYRGVGITNLENFALGHNMGVSITGKWEGLKIEEYYKLQDYIIKHTYETEDKIYYNGRNHTDCLLIVSDGDQRKAFDLFYELLDDFIDQAGIIINLD